MAPTYHLAPNLSIPPDHEIQLGTIVMELTNLEPLNNDSLVTIPEEKVIKHQQTGFTATRSQLQNGDYGVWAKMVGSVGIGGEISLGHERTQEDTYRFEKLETVYFTPTQEYLKQAMHQPDIRDTVEGSGYKPVYMVTGIKIARGPAVELKHKRRHQGRFELGLNQPLQSPIEVGPRVARSNEQALGTSFDESDDFIFAFRFKRLFYKRWLVFWKQNEFTAENYNKGATLEEERQFSDSDEIVDEDISISDPDITGFTQQTDSEATWLAPAV